MTVADLYWLIAIWSFCCFLPVKSKMKFYGNFIGSIMLAIVWPMLLLFFPYLFLKKSMGLTVIGDSPKERVIFEAEACVFLLILAVFLYSSLSSGLFQKVIF